ncbi:MAG TPA: DUF5996 family protein [Candidatus Polarisedimenticolia bacterium]|jgi:hypothetical protein|nr:DUF5996 family protein [Candidatus Polarisedimenticolia bacterium]
MTADTVRSGSSEAWPPLPLDQWEETCNTLQLWTQIVGKTRLALAPMQNHWWQVALYVTARGLGTSPIPHGGRSFEVDFDFVDHRLLVRTSDGKTETLPLEPRTVADFYRRYLDVLRSLGISPRIRPVPNEVPNPLPFQKDEVHRSYDPDAARRFWRALIQADRVLKEFRGRFLGKCSPVHFWWGSFDLSCTRFSGRAAPPHPGGLPGLADWVTREAYSHECISAGFWPGNGGGPVREPAFYSYAYPEPPGCSQAPIRPAEASYHPVLHEWILPYAAVLRAPSPDALLLDFLGSTYGTAARLGGWDQAALERRAPPGEAPGRAGS